MLGGAFQTQKVGVGGVEHNVQEETTDDHVAGVAQGDDHLQLREYAQPEVQPGRRGGILVHDYFGGGGGVEFAEQALEITFAQLGSTVSFQAVERLEGGYPAGSRRAEPAGDLLADGLGRIEGEDFGMGVQDLLNEGGATARVAAEKSRAPGAAGDGRFLAPAADVVRRQLG